MSNLINKLILPPNFIVTVDTDLYHLDMTEMYERDISVLSRLIDTYNDKQLPSTKERILNILKGHNVSEKKEEARIEKSRLRNEEKRNKGAAKRVDKAEKDYAKSKALLLSHPNFGQKDGDTYLKPFKIPMPSLLVARILAYLVELSKNPNDSDAKVGLRACVNFWLLCLLNIDPIARHDLFKFLETYGLVITPCGFFVAYKAVNLVEEGDYSDNNELLNSRNWTSVISAEWSKVKGQRKSPKNYSFVIYRINKEVIGSNIFITKKGMQKNIAGLEHQVLGTLEDLYVSGIQRTELKPTFASIWDSSYRFTIGEEVWMDRSRCISDPHRHCAAGLHVGAPSYVKDYGRHGSNPAHLAVLVNPRHVVAVPKDMASKIRTCRYYVMSMLSNADELNRFTDEQIKVLEYDYYKMDEAKLKEDLLGITDTISEYAKPIHSSKSEKDYFLMETLDKDTRSKGYTSKRRKANNLLKQSNTKHLTLSDVEAIIAARYTKLVE